MEVIGIAGGSGAGKSTVSYKLVDDYPDRFESLNLDDYQKPKTEPGLPVIGGMINWDHPAVIRWDDLKRDIETLRRGKEVRIDTWAHRSNPNYAKHGNMMLRALKPTPVLIVEGYLALYRDIIDVYDRTFFLDLDADVRGQRRRSARGGKDTIIGNDDYVEKVLKPMHHKYVEPTKSSADVVIDVTDLTAEQVAERILKKL